MSDFVCCECGVKRGSKEALESHLCIKHLQWTPFECFYCLANHRCTREATEHDLIVHINEAHPGQQNIKILFISDNQKRQLLKDKMLQSTISVMQQNRSTANRPLPRTSTVPEVAAERIKTEVITLDDEEDYKPPPVDDSSGDVDAADAQSTNHITHSTSQELSYGETSGRHPGANSAACGGTEPTGVEGENNQLTRSPRDWRNIDPHESDDDDFKPDESDGDDFEPCPTPPNTGAKSEVGDDDDFKPDTGDSQFQQPDAGHCSGVRGRNKRRKLTPKVKGKGAKTAKPKQRRGGYCLTCERHYDFVYHHLQPKLSSPIYECSKCTCKTKHIDAIQVHIRTLKCRGAKVVRIRSKDDVAAEIQQLRETHFGLPPPAKRPYRCTKCKRGIAKVPYHILKHHLNMESYECPVCGWSGYLSAVRAHMEQKHRSSNIVPISNEVKYNDRIREMREAVIVRNE